MRTPQDMHLLPQDTQLPPDARRDRWTAHRAHRRQEFVAAALDAPVPAARPVLSLRTSDLAAAPGGSR